MITAYIGKRGTGKTLRMVKQAVEDMKHGKKCISNTRIQFEYKGKTLRAQFFKDAQGFEDAMLSAYNATICIDEAGLIFDSQAWPRLPHHVKVKFMESRKDACNLYYTAQGMNHVNERLRSVTELAIYCWKVHPLLGLNRIPYIRIRYIPLLWRTFPKFIAMLKKLLWSIKVQEPNAQTHYRKAIKWYLHNIFTRIYTPLDAYGLKAAYTQVGNLLGHKQIMGKKWWQAVYKTDVLYPSQYRKVWRQYDTMLHVDSYMFIKKRRIAALRKNKSDNRRQANTNTSAVTAEVSLLNRGRQSIATARTLVKEIDQSLLN